MHTFTLKRVLGFTGAIALVLALLVWGVGLETIKARQVDLLYLGKQHLLLVFTSMFFALVIGIPSGILLSRPAAKGFAEYVMQLFNVGNTLPPLAVLALAMVIIGIGDVPAIFRAVPRLASSRRAQYLRRALFCSRLPD
ncbi:ABC transporter [Citrobacter koseri]|uniref:ABC transporter n=1 Tax=Citrobacter koseri TaxID=545 RepID=A0A2X2WFF5_CITKO|nr:ABC transporter [Citrobacter koseri]